MSLDTELQKHYALLLGVGSPWEVKTVDLILAEKQVAIELGWQWGADAQCPECGRACSIHNCAPERTWRHLDTMQFKTVIWARTPRAHCPEHGVKTMAVPWAAPQGRFTLLFERLAVEVLLAAGSISQACGLLGIGWDTAQEIMRRAVERGLEHRQLEGLKHLGMDEKSFRRGQSYVTLLTDLDACRVLDVVEERTAAAADQLWQTLTPEQKQAVEAVAVDMWEPFIRTIQQQVPAADIVHDKFHVSQYLGEAVDQVRRQEHKELMAQGDETLKGTRQLWLYNPQNFSPDQAEAFSALKDLHLKVARAWAAKELFTKFWEYQEPAGHAKHWQTGEVIPATLVEKIKQAERFNQGFRTVEYLGASLLDMEWHTLACTAAPDTATLERIALARMSLPAQIPPRYRSTYFQHIFAGGYSAGYYSYIWAEVLDADAYEAFKEKGIFDQATARSFRVNVLEKGNSEDPMVLYGRFRGRAPSVEPLLEKRGLKQE